MDLKGDNIVFARVGLVKISLQPCGHEDAVDSSWCEGKLELEIMSQICIDARKNLASNPRHELAFLIQ